MVNLKESFFFVSTKKKRCKLLAGHKSACMPLCDVGATTGARAPGAALRSTWRNPRTTRRCWSSRTSVRTCTARSRSSRAGSGCPLTCPARRRRRPRRRSSSRPSGPPPRPRQPRSQAATTGRRLATEPANNDARARRRRGARRAHGCCRRDGDAGAASDRTRGWRRVDAAAPGADRGLVRRRLHRLRAAAAGCCVVSSLWLAAYDDLVVPWLPLRLVPWSSSASVEAGNQTSSSRNRIHIHGYAYLGLKGIKRSETPAVYYIPYKNNSSD